MARIPSRRWFVRSKTKTWLAPRRAPEPFRPEVFILEDRVAPATLTLSPGTPNGAYPLPPGTDNLPYHLQLGAVGGSGSYSFSVSGLPNTSGLSLSTTGFLSGTPTQASPSGGYSLTVTATDNANASNTGSEQYTLVVNPLTLLPGLPSALQGSGSTVGLPEATIGTTYNQTITVQGGTGPYTFTETSLPAWLAPTTNNNQLTLMGTAPANAETKPSAPLTFTVKATDTNSLTTSEIYSLIVMPTMTITATFGATTLTPTSPAVPVVLPQGTVNASSYPTVTFAAQGGTGPWKIEIPPNPSPGDVPTWSLPAGFSITNNQLTGDPSKFVAGPHAFVLQVTDSLGNPSTQEFSLNIVNAGPLQLAALSAAQTIAFISTPYNPQNIQTFTASGGSGNYQFTVSSGNLPSGMRLAKNGVLSGMPSFSADGSYIFRVTVTDTSSGKTTSARYDITVAYTPQQVKHAYGLDSIMFPGGVVGNGAGQTIAIVDAEDVPNLVSSTNMSAYLASDLAKFDAQFNIPDFGTGPGGPVFLKLDQNGGTNLPVLSNSDGGGETLQDVEWAHALAPGASIVLFEANSLANPDLSAARQAAVNYLGNAALGIGPTSVVSDSIGGSENKTTTIQSDFLYLTPMTRTTGLTYINAAGDTHPLNGVDSLGTPSTPAISPFVLAAGGTTLLADQNGNHLSEFGWQDNSSGGKLSGTTNGGISKYENQPSYQNVVVSPTLPSPGGTRRTNPDVAFLADSNTAPFEYNSYGYGNTANWTVADGTSLAAPSWAAIMAIVDQGLTIKNGVPSSLDGYSQTLPGLYSISQTSGNFYSLTNLAKDSYNSSGVLSGIGAGTKINPSYNVYTGLGSPIANMLVPALVGTTDTISGQLTSAYTGTGLAGFTIFLSNTAGQTAPTPGEQTAVTALNGTYSFSVSPGSYFVNVVAPPGYTPSPNSVGPYTFAIGATSSKTANLVLTPPAANLFGLGAYRPSNGTWSLDSNGQPGFQTNAPPGPFPGGDRVIPNFIPSGVNPASVIPVSGDWASIGTTAIGDFVNGTWYLDLDNSGVVTAADTFTFGTTGDVPVPGAYLNPGEECLAVFRSFFNLGYGEFIISDQNWLQEAQSGQQIGIALTFIYGAAGDNVVVGDWNGAGLAEVGVYRQATAFGAPSAYVFTLDIANQHAFNPTNQVFIFGAVGDGVVIGDWTGSGTSKVGTYRAATAFGAPGTAVFSLDTVGFTYVPGQSETFLYGLPTDLYVTGMWAYTTGAVPVGGAVRPHAAAFDSGLAEMLATGNHPNDPTALDAFFAQG